MIRAFGLSGQRWPSWLLIASLLLNGFLLGMIAVDWLTPHRGRGRPSVVDFELRRLAERLPPDALRQVETELAPHAAGLDQRFAELRAMREDVYRLVAAPQPDRDAIEERLAVMRAERDRLQADLHRATYDALLKLAPEVRAELAAPGERR